MGPTGDEFRVVQVHVSRRCNLACRHCYSTSGPRLRDEVPVGLFRDAIADAAAEGYNVAGFSGGEPLMYDGLRELLIHARTLGMVATVTTNGMLLDARHLALLEGAASLVAISLDGLPGSHDRMRDHPGAFATMAKRLPALRASGIPFGFIFTLTQHNLDELPWVAQFALDEGARLLQIHPLEGVGRGAAMSGSTPDATELAYAVLAVGRIQALVGERLRVQLDVAGRDAIAADPDRVFAGTTTCAAGEPLATYLSPLIVEADGTVVPVEYSFGPALALGNLREAPLRTLAARWKVHKQPAFERLCRDVHAAVTAQPDVAVVNWYGLVSQRSAGEEIPARAWG